ncbi:hypothetical protein GmHk_15G044877 [Glycine max]|nr:hypothetical protein GmHk_15G044877 [Glycine max]
MGTSDGTNASNISAVIMPTGKKRRISGGGGRGGNISGSTTIDAATATRIRIDTALKNCTMFSSRPPLHQIPAKPKTAKTKMSQRKRMSLEVLVR